MDYVKGLVVAEARKNKEECIRHATEAAQMFIKEHGATGLVECWGDDMPVDEKTLFRQAVQCREDGTGRLFMGDMALAADEGLRHESNSGRPKNAG